MKLLIALLTAATGILHVLVGFNVVPGNSMAPDTGWLLIANGVGYLVLLALFFTSSGPRRGTIRWILLAYTLITLVGYFIIGEGFAGGTIPLVIKAIELLLIILLFLDRGSDRVVAPAPAVSTSRMGTGVSSTAASTWSSASASATTAAAGAAGGAAAVGGAAVYGASRAMDETQDLVSGAVEEVDEFADDVVDTAGDAVDYVGDKAGDAVDYVGDKVGDAYDATTDMAGDAVDYVGDKTGDMAHAAGDMVEETGDALSGMAGAAAAGVGAVVGGMAAAEDEVVEADYTVEGADMADDASRLAGMDVGAVPVERAEPTVEELRADLEDYLRSFGPSSEFRKEIEYVEGIGPAFGQKLRAAGVNTVLDLMVNGATRRGRKNLSDQSGVAQSAILTWVNHVDLFRIKGIAQEYADLLEQSGVDTVVELAQRNPANLHKRMLDLNEQKALVRRAPHLSEVQSWVEQAKGLRRLVHY